MKIVKTLVMGFLLFLPGVIWACFAPKPEQVADPVVLIKRTNNIYLAEALGSLDGKVDFKVIERIKGKKREKFQVPALITEETGTDFKAHTLESFWSKSGGRGQIEPSCEIVPNFQKGKKYLVFLDKPYHLKSFELIETDGDVWLKKVREKAKPK
ncbi:hypothetical protein QJS83_02530 [Bdellovibrio sp. 22V]|uniref:hypothetical protein n=1 Tax=Bdellovibrio sp. 22V TaxID=3044166 RepID=UPI002543529F|nr:hypothetical protein [Bdellovibrio sp. 22V]WII72745.1 hypothetical protein QJS83_02530 [Bdellovibrio sp. 22V]